MIEGHGDIGRSLARRTDRSLTLVARAVRSHAALGRAAFGLLALGCAVLSLALAGPAGATPGNALLVLEQGPATGDFDARGFLRDWGGFPARAAGHPHGWAIAWRPADPPPGWSRPLVVRGGGRAANGALLDPRYAPALARMLAGREAGIVALLDAPDSSACYPGKPNPHPFARDGWLFLHDGVIDVAAATTGIWRADWGEAWEAFKADHPRDYDGNGDSTRGNASEIYFLTLLYEIGRGPGVSEAFGRTVLEFSALAAAADASLNAILQGPSGTWVLRYAPAEPERYRLFHGLTLEGEHCIVDSLPGSGSGWQEIPNATLAFFPRGGEVAWEPLLLPSSVHQGQGSGDGGDGPVEDDREAATDALAHRLVLAAEGGPSPGRLRLRYALPAGDGGAIEILDPAGRRVARLDAPAPSGTIEWIPAAEIRSGILYARLRAGRGTLVAPLLFLR